MKSILIAAYNEEKGIAKCIDSILPQLALTDEIIVVSSGSTDKTNDIVLGMPDERIRLIVQKERKGKASAINLGVRKAKGEVIVQTDADVELNKKAIEHLMVALKDADAVSGCPMPIINDKNLFYDWTIMSYRKMDEIRKKEDKEGIFWHLCGYLLAFKKSAYKEIPENMKGAIDAWIGKLMKDNGAKIVYAPYALVYVNAPTNTKDFIAQKARVRAGFSALPNMSRTAIGEMNSFPKEFLKVPTWRKHKFIYCAFVYLWSWIKGKWMFKTNKPLNYIWRVPKSTK